MKSMLHQIGKSKKPKLFAAAILVGFLSVLAGSAGSVSADTLASGQDLTTQYCVAHIDKKITSICTDTGKDSAISKIRTEAGYSGNCQDQPQDKVSDCIETAALTLLKAALTGNPTTTTSFNRKLDTVLSRDVQLHHGSLTTPIPKALQSLAPDVTCGNNACPPETSDPAACAADPSLEGCTGNADAACNQFTCDFVKKYINPAITTVTIIFGLIVAISLISGGIQYSASGGDPQKVNNAKKRISMTILALVAYAFMYGFLQFLVPGGIF